jgi:hypothetical protein
LELQKPLKFRKLHQISGNTQRGDGNIKSTIFDPEKHILMAFATDNIVNTSSRTSLYNISKVVNRIVFVKLFALICKTSFQPKSIFKSTISKNGILFSE